MNIIAGPQASFRFHTLPVRPKVRSVTTDTGPVAEPSTKNTDTSILTGLSILVIHVPDRFTNCHREASSPRLTALIRPIQWHLKNNWRVLESLEKVILIPRSLHPHLQWWLEESNVLLGQPLHPLQHALQVFTDTSKEAWGTHLNMHTSRGTLFLPESKLHIN